MYTRSKGPPDTDDPFADPEDTVHEGSNIFTDQEDSRNKEDDGDEDYTEYRGTLGGTRFGTPPGATPQGGSQGTRNVKPQSVVVAAIDKLLNVKSESLLEDIKWQIGPGVSKDEVAGQMELRIFMFLLPGNKGRTVSFLHSIAQCFAAGQEHGKYVGFVGDVTDVGVTLAAVELQQVKSWETLKETISADVEEYKNECEATPAIKTKEWKATGTMREVADIPRLLHVPLILAKYLLTKGGSYTPYDVLEVIATEFVNDIGEVEKMWEPIIMWCLVAAQSNKIQIDVVAIIEHEPEFVRWTTTRLATTLGYNPTSTTGGQGHGTGTKGDTKVEIAEAVSRGVARVMLQQGAGPTKGGTNGKQGNADSDDKTEYDDDDKALLMGFSMVSKFPHVPSIWKRIKGKRPDVARRIVVEQMEEAAFAQRITIEKTIYIEEKNMKDIQKLRFNPGVTAQFSTANEGLTPLLCRSRSPREQEYLTKRESAIEETSRTRTFDDAMAKPKFDPKFPESFSEMKVMLETYMILVWVFFGDCCPMYDQLLKVSHLLSSRQVQLVSMQYNKQFCMRITWAIFEESRRYFDQSLTADAFNSGNRVRYPEVHIHGMLNDIRTGTVVMRVSYPSELRKIENDKERGRGGGGGDTTNTIFGRGRGDNQSQRSGRGGGGGRGTGGYGDRGGRGQDNNNNYQGGRYSNNNNNSNYQNGGGYYNNNNNYRGNYSTGQQYNGNNSGQGLRNAKIEAMMRPYFQKFPGAVNFMNILDEGNLRLYDLPALGIVDQETGKQALCWPYALGHCRHPNCRFAAQGGHPETVPGEFADEVCRVLGPCVKSIVAGEQSPTKKVKPEGGTQT